MTDEKMMETTLAEFLTFTVTYLGPLVLHGGDILQSLLVVLQLALKLVLDSDNSFELGLDLPQVALGLSVLALEVSGLLPLLGELSLDDLHPVLLRPRPLLLDVGQQLERLLLGGEPVLPLDLHDALHVADRVLQLGVVLIRDGQLLTQTLDLLELTNTEMDN